MNPIVPSYELRRRALNALKPVFPVALLVSLFATLPTLLAQVAVARNSGALIQVLTYFQEHPATSSDTLLEMFGKAMTPQLTVSLGILFVASAVCAFLRLGRYHYLLKVLRGQEGDLSDVLSRGSIFIKALGQHLYTLLLTFLWNLPGVGLTILGVVIMVASPSRTTLNLMMGLYLAGLVLSTVLSIRATIHYCVAPIILADNPETGIRASVRQSLDIMRNRKLLYISLLVSFIGWILLESLAETLLTGLLPLLGMTIGMGLQLALALYQDTAVVAFYEAYRPGATKYTGYTETTEQLNT